MSAPDASPPPDAPAAAPSGKSVPLPLILAVVAGLAGGVGAGFFAVGPALATGIAPAVAANAKHGKAAKGGADAGDHGDAAEEGAEGGHDEAAAGDEEGGDEEGGDEEAAEGGHGKEGAAAGAPVYTLDNLVLNPAESGGTRFLLLTISFEVKKAETVDAMKARDAELRDLVLVTVGNKTVEQLSDVAARDSLREELKGAAAKLFKKRAVKRVYFPQFVIQ